jgi:hypothetical protein
VRSSWLVLAVLLLAGCGDARSTKPPPKGIRPAGRVVHAAVCHPRPRAHQTACRSPDGAWTAGFGPGAGPLVLTRVSTGKSITGHRFSDSCCAAITWVRPHRLLFADVVHGAFTLTPPTGKARFVANFVDFSVSPGGRWLVGDARSPLGERRVGLISLATGRCVLVPGDYIGSTARPVSGAAHAGFSPSSDAVVTARAGTAFLYRIRSLTTPCPAWMTHRP